MRIAGSLMLGLVSAAALGTECAPPKLVRIVTEDVGLTAEEKAKPQASRVIYRLGRKHLRHEQDGIVSIVDIPHVWTLDTSNNTAEHGVDPDPTPALRAPLFDGEGMPEDISAIEIGCEPAFITDPATTHEPVPSEKVKGMQHSRTSGEWRIVLLTRDDKTVPVGALISFKGRVVRSIRYRAYEYPDTVPPDLFKLPAGVTVTEAQ